MSESLGAALPESVLRRLAHPTLEGDLGEAILIATTDPEGRPHPALLSFGEVLARGTSTLVFATYASSATARHLRERGAVTFCFVSRGSAVYVKARARESAKLEPAAPRADSAGLARFEAQVEEVRLDRARAELEGAAEIASGITFRVADPAAKALEWARRREALA
jgi:hypothetical protein